MKTVKDYIRTIVDFPHEGILFRDVTTLFADPRGFRMAIDQMLHPYAGMQIDKVVGLEARGFILWRRNRASALRRLCPSPQKRQAPRRGNLGRIYPRIWRSDCRNS